MRIGVLALQGDHEAHSKAVAEAAFAMGVEVSVELVRRPQHLHGLVGLVLPGGESTTMLKLLALEGLDEAIIGAAARGCAVLGTCAGAILLSREVRGPSQASLGLLDAVAERNSYGRQNESFIADLELLMPLGGGEQAGAGEGGLSGVFIRAPRLLELGDGVEVLARHDGEPVLVRQGNILAATFHPELTNDRRVHALLLEMAREQRSE